MPQYPPRPEMAGFAEPRLRGTSAFARRLEKRLPGVLARHAMLFAWVWVGVFAAVALTEELTDIPPWVFTAATILIALPSLIATALSLWATPRYQLLYTESILTHFVARFLAVIFAFVAWTVSIVIGASISSLIQLIAENNESKVVGTGFELMGTIIPGVAVLIWLGLIMRCSWFLIRLRGWRAYPKKSRLPDTFLGTVPLVRQLTIALAHPGLLATAGLLSAIGTVLVAMGSTAIDFTI